MALTIRFAGPDDAGTIYRFICELADYERAPHEVETDPNRIKAQLEESSPPFECLIAEEGRMPLGFALFFHNYSTWKGKRGIYLEDLFVPPRYRGNGVGRALLQSIAAIAVQRDCARMEWAVLDWNTPAFEFYRRCGALRMDDWVLCRITGAPLRELAEPMMSNSESN